MSQNYVLQKILRENELALLARSPAALPEALALMQTPEPTALFVHLARAYGKPMLHWKQAVMRVWQLLQADFPSDREEFETHAAHLTDPLQQSEAREALRLWLWRRVVRSGRQDLMASRFFCDNYLFHRVLHDDRMISWYGARQAEWPIQLLLALLLESGAHTQRLRLQLYWPTAKLPADFVASHAENRVLRRLWEARILVRFGKWAHLHPAIILLLPEISFAPPVFAWRGRELVAHMQDGRVWPITPFNLAALMFDEALALFQRDRRGQWRNFVAYAHSFLARPEDVASHAVLQSLEEWGLHAVREAGADFLKDFAESILFCEQLRRAI